MICSYLRNYCFVT